MCGRYTLISLSEFTDLFPWIRGPDGAVPPRYNIAPTQPVIAVANKPDPHADHFYWGLVPHWAKDPSIGSKMINARAETVADKPSFRNPLRRRRCVIPASGFYEWKLNDDGKTKTPMYITVDQGKPFAFAGLWDHWGDDKGNELTSCTIITTTPNALMEQIHNRMPVILDEPAMRRWLDPAEQPAERMLELLNPFDPARMQARAVSRAVNNPRNDRPDLLD
jgi:putative SOS response-associated peptidase YedK